MAPPVESRTVVLSSDGPCSMFHDDRDGPGCSLMFLMFLMVLDALQTAFPFSSFGIIILVSRNELGWLGGERWKFEMQSAGLKNRRPMREGRRRIKVKVSLSIQKGVKSRIDSRRMMCY